MTTYAVHVDRKAYDYARSRTDAFPEPIQVHVSMSDSEYDLTVWIRPPSLSTRRSDWEISWPSTSDHRPELAEALGQALLTASAIVKGEKTQAEEAAEAREQTS